MIDPDDRERAAIAAGLRLMAELMADIAWTTPLNELTEMQAVNHDLNGEVDRLKTDDGIREAAREELRHVQAGDNRQTMLELPPLPSDLPDGWPYSQVEAILALRVALAAPSSSEPAAPAGTAAPTTVGAPPTTAVAPSTAAGPTTTAAP